MSKEMVNHPSHYNKPGQKECIEVMKDLFGEDARIIFSILNAFKYGYRCGEKDAVEQEQAKIKWYEDFAEKHLNDAELPITYDIYNAYWTNKNKQK